MAEYFIPRYNFYFEVSSSDCKEQILKLLKLFKSFGIVGATRGFKISDPTDDFEKEWEIYFDGDGDHRLDNIIVQEMKIQGENNNCKDCSYKTSWCHFICKYYKGGEE